MNKKTHAILQILLGICLVLGLVELGNSLYTEHRELIENLGNNIAASKIGKGISQYANQYFANTFCAITGLIN